MVLSRRHERIGTRHKRISDWLDQNKAFSAEGGKTADEIANGINEPVSTIRIDLKSMTESIAVDDTRTPYKYYKRQRRT